MKKRTVTTLCALLLALALALAVYFAAAKAKHEAMGCICYVNEEMGIYFIEDPDGYWIEIIPPRLSGR